MAEGRAFSQAPAGDVDDDLLAELLAERDDLRTMLATTQARLSALEEVAAHAAVLESEMADARARMPEMKIAADAAARRAADLSEALRVAESERDALRSALEARLRAMDEPVLSQETEPDVQEELHRPGAAVASIWISEGVGGAVEALVDLRDSESTFGSDQATSGGGETFEAEQSGDETGEAGSDMASAGSDPSGQARLHKWGRSQRKHPPEDPTSWT